MPTKNVSRTGDFISASSTTRITLHLPIVGQFSGINLPGLRRAILPPKLVF
jgi:hypothetical protein